VKQNASFSSAVTGLVTTRNRRSVWAIPTQSFDGAHFATFPEALVEPCILAGSRPGDIVFDPFMGSGTVASVAQRLGRRWLGAELNPEYIALQAARTRQPGLVLDNAA
jgi:site-specific DNA-methyltransferase (cytosine-N4-specific)